MNILITGGGFQNKGAEAMLQTARQQLGRRLPDSRFFAAVNPDEHSLALGSGFEPASKSWLAGRSLPALRRVFMASMRLPGSFSIPVNSFLRHILPALRSGRMEGLNIDAIVDISGYAFFENESWYAMNMIAAMNPSSKKQIGLYFLPQAWGPFSSAASRFWIKAMLDKSSGFYSRDASSAAHLADALGGATAIRCAPDIAFLFQGEQASAGGSILKAAGRVDSNRPAVGIVPNMRVYERTAGKAAQNEYVKTIEAVIRFVLKNMEADIVLLPNECRLNRGRPDDRFLCSLLQSRFTGENRVIALTDSYTAGELKSIVANMELLVASRFHSLIFALSQSVPAMALGWSHKYFELLKSFGLERYVVSHEKLDAGNTLELLQSAWDSRMSSVEMIQSNLPAMKDGAAKVFDEIADDISWNDNA
jgi:polysaccharide pyruvyl transferase WcaK-like protein